MAPTIVNTNSIVRTDFELSVAPLDSRLIFAYHLAFKPRQTFLVPFLEQEYQNTTFRVLRHC